MDEIETLKNENARLKAELRDLRQMSDMEIERLRNKLIPVDAERLYTTMVRDRIRGQLDLLLPFGIVTTEVTVEPMIGVEGYGAIASIRVVPMPRPELGKYRGPETWVVLPPASGGGSSDGATGPYVGVGGTKVGSGG